MRTKLRPAVTLLCGFLIGFLSIAALCADEPESATGSYGHADYDEHTVSIDGFAGGDALPDLSRITE